MKTAIRQNDSCRYSYLEIDELEDSLKRVEQPKLVPNCCIYRVPKKIRKINEVAYTPQVVSIGPLHHGDKKLEPMEELKKRYLKSYLERTGMDVKDCIRKVKEKERDIRDCYADIIPATSEYFVRMIVIDACFIIEYFLRFIEFSPWDDNNCNKNNSNKSDPIISKPCRIHDMKLDLILLENQLPFYVLEDLFTPTCVNDEEYSSFLEVSFYYFSSEHNTVDKSTFNHFREHCLPKKEPTEKCDEVKVLHLTDFLRIFYLPCRELQLERTVDIPKHLYSASRLQEAGVKFKVSKEEEKKSLIELKFDKCKGVLTMPHLLVDDDTDTLLRNMVALEQCHYPFEGYIYDYTALLDFLINEKKDVDILVDKGIMVNLLGDNEKVVALFNNICIGTMAVDCSDHLLQLSKNLDAFYEWPLHKYKAIFIRDYFSSPWKIASLIAAVLLLLLTLIQTICSVIYL